MPWSNPVQAQGLAKTLYKDKVNGFKFRPPSKFDVVPSKEDLLERGLLCRMLHEEHLAKVEIWRLTDKPFKSDKKADKDADKDDQDKDKDKDRSRVGSKRQTLPELLEELYEGSFNEKRSLEDKKFKANGNVGRKRIWSVSGYRLEAYTFKGEKADIHLLYYLRRSVVGTKKEKKWTSMISKSGRSFDLEKILGEVDLSTMSYKQLLSYHKKADKQFKEWRVMSTPKKYFIVKTSSKRGAFAKNVVSRLEKSRALYVKDFPPEDFGMAEVPVGIVRICGTYEEFLRYGQVRSGVVGYFNFVSEELVLFAHDEKTDFADDLVMGTASHEAFHQYCHFLFRRSQAHRWFDEGHGDYYGSASWFQGKVYINPEAEGDGGALRTIKKLIDDGDEQPLEKHLNFSHAKWQSYGYDSYVQSWSIIHMLRQGALGKVPSKYWRKEYATIIPNYIDSLLKGYSDEYTEVLKEREEEAKDEGRELTAKEKQIAGHELSQAKRNKILKKAMEASWGKVDIDEFESLWLKFVAEHM